MSEILPGVHCISSDFGGRRLASYLLAGKQMLLVDSGLAYTPEETLVPYMSRQAIRVEDIRWLLVTHASGDHFGGNAALKRRSPGAAIIAHEYDAPAVASHAAYLAEHIDSLRQEGVPTPNWSASDPEFLALHGAEVAVDRVVCGGEELDLGDGWRVTLLHAPGHTPGHLMVHDPLHRLIVSGDAFMGDGIPDRENRLSMPPHYFDVDWYLNTILTARSLRPQHLLATHYPPLSGKEVGDFLDRSETFVWRFNQTLQEALGHAARPAPIAYLIQAARGRLGIPGADYQYGLLIRAHLRWMVRQNRACLIRENGIPAWALASQSS